MPEYIKTQEEFLKTINEYSNLVVVDFTASWCGPCQDIAPFFDELSAKYTDVIFIKVDVDENVETSEVCNVQGMPTFQFYRKGEILDQVVGGDRKKLVESIEKYRVIKLNMK